MIGKYLGTLTVEQEDRVLTGKFVPLFSDAFPAVACACLVMCADGVDEYRNISGPNAVGQYYETIAARFGHKRINAAIRNRILANQARRTLQPGLVRASL